MYDVGTVHSVVHVLQIRFCSNVIWMGKIESRNQINYDISVKFEHYFGDFIDMTLLCFAAIQNLKMFILSNKTVDGSPLQLQQIIATQFTWKCPFLEGLHMKVEKSARE